MSDPTYERCETAGTLETQKPETLVFDEGASIRWMVAGDRKHVPHQIFRNLASVNLVWQYLKNLWRIPDFSLSRSTIDSRQSWISQGHTVRCESQWFSFVSTLFELTAEEVVLNGDSFVLRTISTSQQKLLLITGQSTSFDRLHGRFDCSSTRFWFISTLLWTVRQSDPHALQNVLTLGFFFNRYRVGQELADKKRLEKCTRASVQVEKHLAHARSHRVEVATHCAKRTSKRRVAAGNEELVGLERERVSTQGFGNDHVESSGRRIKHFGSVLLHD